MAIILIHVEDAASLALNEFYDYNGRVYAMTCSRVKTGNAAIDLTDFYEATVRTTMLEDIPVVFLAGTGAQGHVIGWYKSARIYKEVQHVSLFLEGNVVASALDVVLLPEETQQFSVKMRDTTALYEVVEQEDSRYEQLLQMMNTYQGENAFQRYGTIQIQLEPTARRDFSPCIGFCELLAQKIVSDQCQCLAEIKSLELYAQKACELKPKDSDGYYYLALAQYQLGFDKKGLKAIEKAIHLEPEAADLQALKGMLLVSRGYPQEGAKHLRLAYSWSHEEDYLLCEGRAWMMSGQMDYAYECFHGIEDKELLENAGIQLNDMEKRWPFIHIRGRKLKELFQRKK